MQQFGPYRLGARLGRGSSGQTFLAARTGEAPVALQIFDPPFSEDTVLAAELQSRVRALSALEASARVQELEVGREPTLHVVSELVGGQPITAVVRKARLEDLPLSQRDVLGLVRPVVEALLEAHRHRDENGHGLVHGSLSPRDVMLNYSGQVRVLGVGMGRMGRLPIAAGRQGYVAAEVLRGRPASPLSDAFSVAALLYELIVGRGPFRSPRAEDAERAVLQGTFSPLKPSQFDGAGGLRDWINETLLPKPELRPGDLEQVIHLLPGVDPSTLSETMRRLFEAEAEGFLRMCAAVSGASRDALPALHDDPMDEVEAAETEPSSTLDLPELVERDADLREELGQLRQVARYHLDARVWSEGSIEEFYGTDPNLDRPIRLRLLSPAADGPIDAETQVRLFKREARYLARVDHPSLPRLLDAGRASERYFTVVGRRPGKPLVEVLAAGQLVDVHRLLRDLIGAMEAAHEVGLLLGSVAIDGVSLTPSGRADLVRLPTLHSARKGPHPLLEGKTAWVPPEWTQERRWDGASDQWIVGALVSCAIVGKAPGPSLAALQDGLLDLEDELLQTLKKMTARDSRARYPSASAIDIGGPRREPSMDLVARFAELCQRAAGLSLAVSEDEAFFDDPARVAEALARRRGLSEARTEALTLSAALRGLARRIRLPPLGEELTRLVPEVAGPLLESMSTSGASESAEVPDGDDPWMSVSSFEGDSRALDAEIVRLSEAFVESHRHGEAPLETRIRALRSHFSSLLVDDLILETEQRLSASEAIAGPRGRLLVAGFGTRELAQKLGRSGLDVVVTQDGHEAWELLRGRDAFVGAIFSQPLRGRDGLSLIKLCRSHPGLARLPIWLAADSLDPQTRQDAEERGALAVDGPERLELLPDLVLRRLVD
ncbi:MAG: hypothetical protein AAF627_15905 [Myxococcota bacterium]